MLPQKKQNEQPGRPLKTQRAQQHRAKTVRRLERGQPGLLQQAGDHQAETKAEQLRPAKLEHGFAPPWFGR